MRYISLVEQVNTLVSDSRKERLLQLAGYRRLVTFLALSAIAVCGTVAQAQVTGKVFRDYNADGFQNTPISSTAVTAGEQGVPGVIVTAYPVTGSPLSATTDINGAYSFVNAGITAAGNKLRLEFSGIPSNLFSGPQSTTAGGSGTIVQFVTASSSTTANLAVNDAAEYCQTNPKWATGCYVNGLATGTDAALVVNNYNASGFASGAPYTQAASTANIGSTWGLAYSRKTKRLFAATYLKRHVGMADGPGFIYYFNFSGSTTPTASAGKFDLQGVTPANGGAAIDLGTVCRSASCSVTGGTSASFVLGAKGAQNIDYDAFLKVGTISYGDADVDEATGKLWVVNLNQKALISVDISGATLPGAVNQYPLSTIPGFPVCTGGKARPFALAFKNGVGYVGVVCDAGTSQNKTDLHAYVLSFDPANPAAGLTSVLDFNLGYKLLTQIGGYSWNPWLETILNGSILPQPMLTDIEFAPDNSMILGLRDRWGDQQGPGNFQPNGATALNSIAAGDILKACYVNGAWIMEGLPGGCPVTATAGGTGVNANGEFFKDTRADTWDEGAEGGLALLPGTGEVVTTFIDPWNGVGSPPNSGAYLNGQGLQYFSTATGSITDFYQVYSLYSPFLPLFGKAEGLSDLQFLCDPSPIEIGNRVWLDKNKDGIQSPDEVPLAGVTVQLFAAGGSTPLATTVTDANGLYVFKSTSTTALTYNTAYEVRIPTTQSALTSLSFTTPNVGTNNGINSDFVPGTTAAVTSLTTGDLGQNVHTFDAGLICDAPTLAAIPSQSICQGGSFAFPLSTSVISGTATGRQWYLTDATGSTLTPIAGATSLTFTPTGTNLPTSTGGTRYYAVSAYNSTTACSDIAFVSLTIKPTQTITFITPAAVTQCANTTMNLSVTTNAKAPDAIKFVYFTSPLTSAAAAYTATGGTVLGTVNSGTLANNTVALNNIQLPDNVGGTAQTWYVYALLQSADGLCLPSAQVTITINPRPAVVISGNPVLCQGKTAVLNAGGPLGTTYQWFLNSGTTPISTANSITTPVISTTTTYRLRGTQNNCVSDDVSIVLTPVPCTPCTASPTSVGGITYRDFGSDGAQGANDPALSNVTVTIFKCDASGASTQVATMVTDINGAYSFTGLTAGTTYRVEFSNLPAGYEPTYRGTQNGTTVQFTQPGSCTTSLGMNQPNDYCSTTARLITPCYVGGSITATGVSDALVSFGYDFTSEITLATKDQIGSTWGVAYNRFTKQIYSSAFLKRHVGLGPNGLGAIYVTNPNTGTANAALFFDLATVDNVGASQITLTDGSRNLTGPTTPSHDDQAAALIAKVGLGDLDISTDGAYLYTISLASKKLWRIPTNAPTAANVTSWTIPNLPNWDLTKGDYRPFAVKYYNNKVYVGLVFDAELSQLKADLAASVYELDPATGVFTEVHTFPMSYIHGAANLGIGGFYPWSTSPPTNLGIYVLYPVPVFSDIEVDPDGTMILGFFDRTGHQFGAGNYYVNSNSTVSSEIGGEILRLGRNPANLSQYLLESAGNFYNKDGIASIGTANIQGPGGGEFYSGENFESHQETSVGGLALKPGSGEVILTAMDPLTLGRNGYISLSQTTGAKLRSLDITSGFGKANGLGDVDITCDAAPIQIGNRVWRDDNQNGIQDPCEPAIPSAVVRLYDAAKTTIIASATTNAAGEYYFSSATVVAGTSTSAVSTSLLTYNTTYGLVITSLGTSTVVAGLSLTNVSPLTPGESGTLNSGTTLANNDAKVDVVGGVSLPCIKLTTGGPGDVNHTYDFGINIPPCVKPTLAVIASQSICQNSGTFSFPLSSSVVSNTITSAQWYLTNAAGTSFTAISGATSLSLSSALAVPPTLPGQKFYALIGQNGISAQCSDTVFVTLYQKATQTIAFTTPASATITQCSNTTLNLSVSTTAKAPDQIRFVQFDSPQASAADAYTATGGTVLGTVTSGTLATNTVSLPGFRLPKNTEAATITIYAILVSADGLCQPIATQTININPQPDAPVIGGEDVVCRNSTISLTTGAATAYRWLNLSTNPITSAGTTQNISPAISTSAVTYGLSIGNALGCYSDTARFTVTPVVCNPCTAGAGKVGGNVFTDYNGDGVKATTGEPGKAGITVNIYACTTDGSSTLVSTVTTDLNGDYFFAGLTDGKPYRVEFVNLPAGYSPTAKGSNNGTTTQFVTSPTCGASLGLNIPTNYCQTNPLLVTPCYLDGAVTPNTTAGTDVLVGVNYDLSGSVNHIATRTEIGSTWGVAYARGTKQLYTGAFLKRHVGLLNGKLGQIFVTDMGTTGTPTTPWLDVSTLPGIAGNWQFATDAARGLTNAGTPSLDAQSFSVIAGVGLGDVDISEDDKTLYVMDLTNRQLLAIDIATRTLIGKYPVPSLCDSAPSTSYFSAGPASSNFISTDGKEWQRGYLFDVLNTSLPYGQVITNANSVTAGTGNAALYATSAYTTTTMRYSFPVGNGTFGVKLHLATNSTANGKNMTVSSEGVAVPTLTNFSTLTAAGGINIGITRSFTTSVSDGVLTLDFTNNTGGGAALVSGFELTTLNGTPTGETRPFALAVHNGKVYVGAICDASHSQSRADLQASVLEFNPITQTYNPAPVLTFPLNYKKGLNVAGGTVDVQQWNAWSSVYPNSTGITVGAFTFYTQPTLSDIVFDVDGSMILGFFDRFQHQQGAVVGNYTPDHTAANGRIEAYGAVGGDLLRAYFNGSSFELEVNGKEGPSSPKAATSGQNNGQGIGGGEFYLDDTALHQEISAGGLAFKPGSGEIRMSVGDPIAYSSGGLTGFNNTTGAKQNGFTLFSGSSGGTQNKANGLGDLEVLCDLAPIQIGNRVWRDDNQNGIQDPCEPPIPGAVVKLYNAAKTTVIASATTNAAGEYYFSSTTITAGTSTSSICFNLLADLQHDLWSGHYQPGKQHRGNGPESDERLTGNTGRKRNDQFGHDAGQQRRQTRCGGRYQQPLHQTHHWRAGRGEPYLRFRDHGAALRETGVSAHSVANGLCGYDLHPPAHIQCGQQHLHVAAMVHQQCRRYHVYAHQRSHEPNAEFGTGSRPSRRADQILRPDRAEWAVGVVFGHRPGESVSESPPNHRVYGSEYSYGYPMRQYATDSDGECQRHGTRWNPVCVFHQSAVGYGHVHGRYYPRHGCVYVGRGHQSRIAHRSHAAQHDHRNADVLRLCDPAIGRRSLQTS